MLPEEKKNTLRFCRKKRDKEAYFEITDAFCMVSFSKLLVCTTDCRNHPQAPTTEPAPRPGWQWRMRQRMHTRLQSLPPTNSRDMAKRCAERRGPEGAGRGQGHSWPGAQSWPSHCCYRDPKPRRGAAQARTHLTIPPGSRDLPTNCGSGQHLLKLCSF